MLGGSGGDFQQTSEKEHNFVQPNGERKEKKDESAQRYEEAPAEEPKTEEDHIHYNDPLQPTKEKDHHLPYDKQAEEDESAAYFEKRLEMLLKKDDARREEQ